MSTIIMGTIIIPGCPQEYYQDVHNNNGDNNNTSMSTIIIPGCPQ
jgi:hypothetical protein